MNIHIKIETSDLTVQLIQSKISEIKKKYNIQVTDGSYYDDFLTIQMIFQKVERYSLEITYDIQTEIKSLEERAKKLGIDVNTLSDKSLKETITAEESELKLRLSNVVNDQLGLHNPSNGGEVTLLIVIQAEEAFTRRSRELGIISTEKNVTLQDLLDKANELIEKTKPFSDDLKNTIGMELDNVNQIQVNNARIQHLNSIKKRLNTNKDKISQEQFDILLENLFTLLTDVKQSDNEAIRAFINTPEATFHSSLGITVQQMETLISELDTKVNLAGLDLELERIQEQLITDEDFCKGSKEICSDTSIPIFDLTTIGEINENLDRETSFLDKQREEMKKLWDTLKRDKIYLFEYNAFLYDIPPESLSEDDLKNKSPRELYKIYKKWLEYDKTYTENLRSLVSGYSQIYNSTNIGFSPTFKEVNENPRKYLTELKRLKKLRIESEGNQNPSNLGKADLPSLGSSTPLPYNDSLYKRISTIQQIEALILGSTAGAGIQPSGRQSFSTNRTDLQDSWFLGSNIYDYIGSVPIELLEEELYLQQQRLIYIEKNSDSTSSSSPEPEQSLVPGTLEHLQSILEDKEISIS